MKQALIIIFPVLIGLVLGLAVGFFFFSFENLSLDQMHQQVVIKRDLGIKKAINEGVYNCCVEPACTMCYMEGNMWNNQKGGRCDCVDFIAQGKEPCPQCKRMLAER